MDQTMPTWLHPLSWLMVLLGLASCLFVAFDIARRTPQPMKVMRYVWPINTLWAGLLGIWAYCAIGRTGGAHPHPRTKYQCPG